MADPPVPVYVVPDINVDEDAAIAPSAGGKQPIRPTGTEPS